MFSVVGQSTERLIGRVHHAEIKSLLIEITECKLCRNMFIFDSVRRMLRDKRWYDLVDMLESTDVAPDVNKALKDFARRLDGILQG